MIPKPKPRDQGVARSDDGTRIAWDRYGDSGPVVLFVPTWNLVDARVVGYQVRDLQDAHTVITYDPRGNGASDRPARGYDFTDHAADAIAVLDANDVNHAAVITASRGTGAAAILAAGQPARVDRLAAIAPYVPLQRQDDADFWEPAATNEGWDLYNAHAWLAVWPAFARFFMEAVFPEPGSAALIDEMVAIALDATPEVLVAQERELDWSRGPALLPSVRCPVLLIHGDADPMLSVDTVQALAALLPDARVELVAGGGHRPDIRSPDLVTPLLARFLDAGDRP